jgi:hypothetical protein
MKNEKRKACIEGMVGELRLANCPKAMILLVKIGADVFINAIPASEHQYQCNQNSKDDDPLHVESMTGETFASVSVSNFCSIGHF